MGALSVAVVQDGNHFVTSASNVKFKKSAPGGDVSASFRINGGHLVSSLRSEAEVYISDRATGEICWYGRVSNPGRRTESDAGYLDVTCDGSMVELDTEKKIRPYVVTRFSAWGLSDFQASYPPDADIRVGAMTAKTNTNQETGEVFEGLTLMIPKGSPVKPWFGPNSNKYKNASVVAKSYAFDGTGYWIGAIGLRYRNYGDSGHWVTRAYLDDGTSVFIDTRAQNEPIFVSLYRGRDPIKGGTPTSLSLVFELNLNNPPDGTYAPYWHDGSSAGRSMNRNVSPPVENLNGDYLAAPFDMYASFDQLAMIAHLWDRYGQPLDTMPYRYWLRAHEVIEDILGRDLLNRFTTDPAYSEVPATSDVPIGTLDYTDRAVSVRQVLDDLVGLTGGKYYYLTLPPRSIGELPGLTWREWPATPRFMVTHGAAIDLVAAQNELVNRVSVRWKDELGRAKVRQYTAHPDYFPDTLDLGSFWHGNWDTRVSDPEGISTVTNLYNPGLGWSRIVEAEPIDLDEDRASPEVADAVGFATLIEGARRERSGTVTVAQVMDLWESSIKRAHLIKPGYALAMNDSDEVIRVTAVEYDDETGTALLSVANPGLDVAQLITRASKD